MYSFRLYFVTYYTDSYIQFLAELSIGLKLITSSFCIVCCCRYRKALEVWKRIGGPYCLTNPKKKPNQSYEKREKGVSPRDKNEKRMWKTLLGFLKKEKKLPVVIFTLSRVRCDKNANSLLSEELTTGEEKKHIQGFFHFSISQLKEEDRKLPQVNLILSEQDFHLDLFHFL